MNDLAVRVAAHVCRGVRCRVLREPSVVMPWPLVITPQCRGGLRCRGGLLGVAAAAETRPQHVRERRLCSRHAGPEGIELWGRPAGGARGHKAQITVSCRTSKAGVQLSNP